MTAITPAAESSRDGSRHDTGQFGTQTHLDSGMVAVDEGPGCLTCTHPARYHDGETWVSGKRAAHLSCDCGCPESITVRLPAMVVDQDGLRIQYKIDSDTATLDDYMAWQHAVFTELDPHLATGLVADQWWEYTDEQVQSAHPGCRVLSRPISPRGSTGWVTC